MLLICKIQFYSYSGLFTKRICNFVFKFCSWFLLNYLLLSHSFPSFLLFSSDTTKWYRCFRIHTFFWKKIISSASAYLNTADISSILLIVTSLWLICKIAKFYSSRKPHDYLYMNRYFQLLSKNVQNKV